MLSLPLRQRLQAYMNVSRLLIRKYMTLISYHLSSHRVLCLVEREGFLVANHYRSSYRSGICICVSFQYSFFPKLVCVSYLLSVLVLRTVSCVVCYAPLNIFLNIILYCILACLLSTLSLLLPSETWFHQLELLCVVRITCFFFLHYHAAITIIPIYGLVTVSP